LAIVPGALLLARDDAQWRERFDQALERVQATHTNLD
jgi:2-methylisocitrate lyase-like PEP mutase family enzyme